MAPFIVAKIILILIANLLNYCSLVRVIYCKLAVFSMPIADYCSVEHLTLIYFPIDNKMKNLIELLSTWGYYW